jgi:hypothetical protein
MAKSTYRVNIPKNIEALLDLATQVYRRHTYLAAASPLNVMVSHKWADNGPNIEPCLLLHKKAEELMRQAEEAYRQRDLLLGEITESIKASRDLLLGVYRDIPKTLGEYGFEVDDSVRAAKKHA